MKLEDQLTPKELEQLRKLSSPIAVQEYLDQIPYVGEDLNRSPLRVMRDNQCHCLDGGLFAAAALRRIGFAPLLLDMVPEPNTDDDHVLAIYRIRGRFGAVAKSNFTGLRFREPVYRTLRELVMSYFDDFFNVDGIKTMRGYTRPIDLSHYDRYGWETSETGIEKVVRRFYNLKSIPVIDPTTAAELQKIDERSYQAGMLGVNYDGLYKPGQNAHD